jgi:oligogalacturonide lyase
VTGPAARPSSVRAAATTRLTTGAWNAQHLYFTGPSLGRDGSCLVVLGDRDRPARGPYDPDAALNVFAVDVGSGEARPLTRNRDGVARAYVTFGGHPDRGIAPGSVAFSPEAGVVVLLQGRAITRVRLEDGPSEILAELPAGVVTGYGTLTADGARYALPFIDAAAFADLHAIDATVRRLGLVSRVLVVDTSSGGVVDEMEVAGGWVTHVQLRPADPATILFNHEWAEGSGTRRLWIRDPAGIRPLRRAQGARTDVPIDAADEVEHETWTADGSAVVYHGVSRLPTGGRPFIGRVSLADGLVTEIALPSGPVRYGHLAARDARTFVTDGIADPVDATADARPGERPRTATRLDGADAPAEDDGGRWISRLDVDWVARRVVPTPLVEHGSSWSSQDAHPHPVFDPGGRSVLFTSDRAGVRAVYRVEASP